MLIISVKFIVDHTICINNIIPINHYAVHFVELINGISLLHNIFYFTIGMMVLTLWLTLDCDS